MDTDSTGRHAFFLEERHEHILDLLDRNNTVSISELSELFGVSPATARKDIRTLESDGKLRRTHGGAIKLSDKTEPAFALAAVRAQQEKIRIGRKAAELVTDGDTMLVQSGTTTREFIRALAGRKQLTIIVSDLLLALEAEQLLPGCEIILLGGSLRSGYHYTHGIETAQQLRKYHVPTAFMCSNAFSFERGITAHNLMQANWVKELLDASDKHIMLLDSTKYGTEALVHAADFNDLDVLVTDTGLPLTARTRLERAVPELEIIYA